MSLNQVTPSAAHSSISQERDLGPLAWILDELRQSLDGAAQALHRFARESLEQVQANPDDSHSLLNTARQQLHQASGALEMVDQPQAATLLRAILDVVQYCEKKPDSCTDAMVQTLESAHAALLEYLETILSGQSVSPVALFPQYRDVQTLIGQQAKAHPADLWPMTQHLIEPTLPVLPDQTAAIAYGPQARAVLDANVLQIVKNADPQASQRLRNLCIGLAQTHDDVLLRTFWKVGAGFFDAMTHGLINPDVYAKRVASRVLMVYASLARQMPTAPQRLLQDMLFFCAQAGDAPGAGQAPVLQAIRHGFALQHHQPLNYEQARFGHLDPVQLNQMRKRIENAMETWAALTAGDRQKIKPAVDQFSLVCESLLKLCPGSSPLASALTRAATELEYQAQVPNPHMAMEVAAVLLYLQATFAATQMADEALTHVDVLAQRLNNVLDGQDAQPLQLWMQQLYRQVNDQQAIGSIVDELHHLLAETEKLLDQFFRVPDSLETLLPVDGLLAQTQGVWAILGQEQAAQATAQMRQQVERLMLGIVPEDECPALFDQLGSNVSILGFLLNMLRYQRNTAHLLYDYDDQTGSLRLLTGCKQKALPSVQLVGPMASPQESAQTSSPVAVADKSGFEFEGNAEIVTDAQPPETVPAEVACEPASTVDGGVSPQPLVQTIEEMAQVPVLPATVPEHKPLQEQEPVVSAEPSPTAVTAQLPAALTPAIHTPPSVLPIAAPGPSLSAVMEDSDAELLEIFLEESREVVGNAQVCLQQLARNPGNLDEQTTLRRAFHTLKGSSRMVGLNEFGEAGWAMEQLLNSWLAEQKPMPETMQQLAAQAIDGFSQWTQAIADGSAQHWQSSPFRTSADAMRLQATLVPLDMDTVQGLSCTSLPVAAVAQAPQEESAPASALQVAPSATQNVTQQPLDLPVEIQEALQALEQELSCVPVLPQVDETQHPADTTALADALVVPPFTESCSETVATPGAESPLSVPSDTNGTDSTFAHDTNTHDAALDSSVAVATILPSSTEDRIDSTLEAQDISCVDSESPPPVQSKKIGDLTISLPLFNVYLGEAENWSQQLYDSLTHWQAHVDQPQPKSAIAWAHSLAGSSATVGFTELSGLARLLEHALLHVLPQNTGVPEQVRAFMLAAEETRALLHQFAAGFLRTPQSQVLAQLQSILDTEIFTAAIPDTTPDPDTTAQELSPDINECLIPQAPELVGDTVEHLDQNQNQNQAAIPVATTESVSDTITEVPAEVLLPTVWLETEEMSDSVQTMQQTPETQLHLPEGASDSIETVRQTACVQAFSPEVALSTEQATEEITTTETSPLPTDSTPDDAAQDDETLRQQQLDLAIARAMAVEDDEDDDIDVFDMVDPDLFPIFEEEAIELLPVLGAAMREWSSHPQQLETRGVLLRALHTLKGSARLSGAMRLGEMAHRLESALEQLNTDTVTGEDIEALFTKLDAIEADFNVLRVVGAQQEAEALVADSVSQPLFTTAGQVTAQELPTDSEPVAGSDAEEVSSTKTSMPQPVAIATEATLQSVGIVAPLRQTGQQTVRVRSQVLDRLVNQAGEVLIARSRLEARIGKITASLKDLGSNLERLRQQLRDVEVQAESQMQSRMQLTKEHGAGFDPLEFDRFTRVQELTRMMAESVNDVATVQRNLQRDVAGAEDDLVAQGREARELQRDLLRTRMVEFDAISERLYTVVRQTAKEMGKQVRLNLSGSNIEMDRGVLERIVPAFEHLLRNCVDHGIESPERRIAAGKPAIGRIQVQVQQEGNDVSVTFLDDGAGLDIARIRDKALAQGFIGPEETVDAARAAQLVFMPGLTTAAQVTGVSGRGIGMDVVRSEVQALGGRIETATDPGQGTTFRLVLPLTTAVTQVVMLRAGEFSVGVPASLVDIVRRISLSELEAAYQRGELLDGGTAIPFFWAGAVWNQSPRSIDSMEGKTRPVLIFRSASQRVALHVDEVLGHQEVVVKNLGPQLARLPGLTGMSVLASGAVALIYNPVALTTVYAEPIRQLGQGLPALLDNKTIQQLQHAAQDSGSAGLLVPNAPSQVPLVMVVDDSITVRRVTQRLLQREGYRVVTAVDGLQALEKLQDELPAVVLSDIEMPRMDGFDLARNIRSNDTFEHLPIVMITSRIAPKHREHARELGVNHYLGKPYSDDVLMALVQHYANGKELSPEIAAHSSTAARSAEVPG